MSSFSSDVYDAFREVGVLPREGPGCGVRHVCGASCGPETVCVVALAVWDHLDRTGCLPALGRFSPLSVRPSLCALGAAMDP